MPRRGTLARIPDHPDGEVIGALPDDSDKQCDLVELTNR